jgi:NTE family protein
MNPLNHNPLAAVVADSIDFAAIQQDCPVKLFLCATNVRTGKVKIFENKDACADTVLASACLPFMFQTVYYQGEPYWDGGYMGNPALYPLVYSCESRDIAVIQINPIERPGTPKTPTEILNRLNEITFNSSLIAEMRAIAFVQRLIDDDHLKGTITNRLKRIHMHMIGDQTDMLSLGVSSKSNTDMEFLSHMKGLGRACADKWLHENFGAIGRHSTVDIRGTFLGA